jgi:hypothetical protein
MSLDKENENNLKLNQKVIQIETLGILLHFSLNKKLL